MAIYYVCRKYEVFLNELIFQHFSIVCIDDDWKSYIKTKLLSLKYVESNTKIDMDQTSDAEKKEVLKHVRISRFWLKRNQVVVISCGVTKVTDRRKQSNNRVTTYSYDALNQVKTKKLPKGAFT